MRTSVPQAWLHAGAEGAVGAMLALTERQSSGRGQHVDVSAQQAVMQAGIPGVLLAPNDNPEAQRTSGGILTGPIHLQFVYPAADGYVSITLLFGSMIGPYTRRLMEWVCEDGSCTGSAGSFSVARMMRLTRSRSSALKSLAWMRSRNAIPCRRFREMPRKSLRSLSRCNIVGPPQSRASTSID